MAGFLISYTVVHHPVLQEKAGRSGFNEASNKKRMMPWLKHSLLLPYHSCSYALVKQQEATMLVQVVLYKNAEDKQQDAARQQ